MTIAQLQNLQSFVINHLSDVIDWGKNVRPDPEHKTTGDQGFILIATPFNRYKMTISSSYIEPPPGAPLTCRSLGTVTFYDPADNKHIVGPKADATYTDISKHIHVRELTDALAAARREMAEASAETAGAARVKLAQLAERAKKWGIMATVPDAPLAPAKEAPPVQSDSRLMENVDLAVGAAAVDVGTYRYDHASGHGPLPWLGAPVVFITNPGEQISGMQEIPGWCVKTYSGDRIAVFMTPDHSEPSYKDALPRRGSAAGNGKVHQFNCWDFNPEFIREQKRVLHLEEAVAKAADEGNADRQVLAALIARVAVLEAERPSAAKLQASQAEAAAAMKSASDKQRQKVS